MADEGSVYHLQYEQLREEGLRTASSSIRLLALDTDFVLLDEGVERHGSWEWLAMNEQGELARYIIVNVIDSPLASRTSWHGRCRVELWGGVEDRQRFGRRLFARRASNWDVVAEFVGEQWQGLLGFVRRLDESALQDAYWFGRGEGQ
jgi:hypothetical protein